MKVCGIKATVNEKYVDEFKSNLDKNGIDYSNGVTLFQCMLFGGLNYFQDDFLVLLEV